MDYFAEERTRQAEEVVKYLPDTIFSAANFPNILTKQEIKEFRQSFKKQKIYKDMVAHKAFKKFMKPGMSALRKAFKHVREKGFEICEGEGGCNSCCRRLVLITSKLEVDTITRAIRLMDFDSKDRLQKAMERRERKYRGIAIACGVTGDEVDEDAWFHMGELYPEVGGMCPALGDTGRCLIYPVRPWTCRTRRLSWCSDVRLASLR